MRLSFKKSTLVALTSIFLVTSLFFKPTEVHAQIPVTDFAQQAFNFIGKTVRKIFSQTYRNFVRRALNNFAVTAAKKLATGGKGKVSLFQGDSWKNALEDEFYASVGNFLEEYDKMLGGVLCAPDSNIAAAILINLPGVQGGQLIGASKSKCDLREVRGRWKKFGSQTISSARKLDFNQFVKINAASQFDEGNNDFGIFLKINEEFAKKTGIDTKSNLIVTALQKLPGYQGISNCPRDIGGNCLAPIGAAGEAKKNIDQGVIQETLTTTGDIVVDAVNVFTNTLVSEYLKRLLADPAFKNPATNRRPAFRNFRDLLAKPRGATVERFIETQFAKPTVFQSTSAYDPLADLVACPDDIEQKTGLNCSMTQELHELARRKEGALNLRQAVDRGELNGSAVIGYIGKNTPPSSPDQGYSVDALINLRKFRIFPVGFEMIAHEIERGNIVTPVTLKQVLDCFDPKGEMINTCNSFDARTLAFAPAEAGSNPILAAGEAKTNPFYHMVDPNWVITIPDTICKAQVYGNELQASQSADRKQYCADVKDCVARDEKGACLEYGNCLTESSVWSFRSGQCPAQYSSCETWEKQGNKNEKTEPVSYVMGSVDSGGCSESSGGCSWVSLAKNANGDWLDTNRIYLNRTAREATCDATNSGCAQYRTFNPGSETIYNGDFNIPAANNHATNSILNPATYGDATLPDGWSWSSAGVEYSATEGNNNSKAVKFIGTSSIEQDVVIAPARNYQLNVFIISPNNTAKVEVYSINNDNTIGSILSGTTGCSAGLARLTNSGSCLLASSSETRVRVVISGANNDIIDDVSLVVGDGTAPVSYVTYEQNQSLFLKGVAPICNQQSVGCTQYTGTDGTTTSLFAVTNTSDICPQSCVGFDAFEQVLVDSEEEEVLQSIGEPINTSAHTLTRFFSPETASICQATEVNCEEYTNLGSSQAGGEKLEYYSSITACVPQDRGTTFYTWEGSAQSGFVIKVWNLFKDESNRPCTKLSGDSCAEAIVCTDVSNPSCRTFYDENGAAANIDINSLVYAVNDCREYRRTRPASDTNGGYVQPIKRFAPSLSKSCSAAASGCREYRGTSALNVRALTINGSFESGIAGWGVTGLSGGGITQSNESINTNGHSLALDTVSGVLLYDVPAGQLKSGDQLSVEFWAKLGSTGVGTSDTIQNPPQGTVSVPINAGTITNDNTWHRYTLNTIKIPATVDSDSSVRLTFDFANTTDQILYIDNIVVKRTLDSLYLIENSWDETLTNQCINFVGCREYETNKNTKEYLYKFNHLCEEKFLGCEAVVATHNSDVPYGQTFNTDTPSVLDDTVIASDTIEYRVNNSEYYCGSESLGCTEIGVPNIDKLNNTVTGYTSSYIKVTPDHFDTTLCSEDTLFCEVYTRGPNKRYFKDPGNNVCTYVDGIDTNNDGAKESGWFKQKTDGGWTACLPGDVRTCAEQYDGCSELLYKPYADRNLSNPGVCYNPQGGTFSASTQQSCEGQAGTGSTWCAPCIDNDNQTVACVTTQQCPDGTNKSTNDVCLNRYGVRVPEANTQADCIGVGGLWEHNSSYHLLSERFSTDECDGTWSEESGCVQFLNNSNNRERLVIRADLDRQCTSWVACKDSSLAIGVDGRARNICNNIATCNKYDPNTPSKCATDGWAQYKCTNGRCDNNSTISCTSDNDCDTVLINYAGDTSNYRNANTGTWANPNFSGASIPGTYPITRLTQVVYDGLCSKGGIATKTLCRTSQNVSGGNNDCEPTYLCNKQVRCFGEFPCYDTNGELCSDTTSASCMFTVKPNTGLSFLSSNKADLGIDGSAKSVGRLEKSCRAYPESDSPFAPAKLTTASNVNTYFQHKDFLKWQNCRTTITTNDSKLVCDEIGEYAKESGLYQNADCNYLKGRSSTGKNIYFNTEYSIDVSRKIAEGNNDFDDKGFKISGLSVYQGWRGFCIQSYKNYSNGNCAFWYPVDVVGGEIDVSINAPEAGLAGSAFGNKELRYCVEDGSNTDLSNRWLAGNTGNPKEVYYCLKKSTDTDPFVTGGSSVDSNGDDVYHFDTAKYSNLCTLVLKVSKPTTQIGRITSLFPDLLQADNTGIPLVNRVLYPPVATEWAPQQPDFANTTPLLLASNCRYANGTRKCNVFTEPQAQDATPHPKTGSYADLSNLTDTQISLVISALREVYAAGEVRSLQRSFGVTDDKTNENYTCGDSDFAQNLSMRWKEVSGDCEGNDTDEAYCVPSTLSSTQIDALREDGSNDGCNDSGDGPGYIPPYYLFYVDNYFTHAQTNPDENWTQQSGQPGQRDVDPFLGSSIFDLLPAADGSDYNDAQSTRAYKSWNRTSSDSSNQYICTQYISVTTLGSNNIGAVDTNLLLYKKGLIKGSSYIKEGSIQKDIADTQIPIVSDASKKVNSPYGIITPSSYSLLPPTNLMCRLVNSNPNQQHLSTTYDSCVETDTPSNAFIASYQGPTVSDTPIFSVSPKLDTTIFGRVFAAKNFSYSGSVSVRNPNPSEFCVSQYDCVSALGDETPVCTLSPAPVRVVNTESCFTPDECTNGQSYEVASCDGMSSYSCATPEDPYLMCDSPGYCVYTDTRPSGLCSYKSTRPSLYTDWNFGDKDQTDNAALSNSSTWPVLRGVITNGDKFSEGSDYSITINNEVVKDDPSHSDNLVLERGVRDVLVRFFGFSPKGRHMPLLAVYIDWGDGTGSTNPRTAALGSMMQCSVNGSNSMPKRCFAEDDCNSLENAQNPQVFCTGSDAAIKNKRAVCDTATDEWGGSKEACDSQIPFTFTHSYITGPGTYTVRVRLYDNWGYFGQVEKVIVIPEDFPVGN